MYRSVLWTLWEREKVGRFGRIGKKNKIVFRENFIPVNTYIFLKDINSILPEETKTILNTN